MCTSKGTKPKRFLIKVHKIRNLDYIISSIIVIATITIVTLHSEFLQENFVRYFVELFCDFNSDIVWNIRQVMIISESAIPLFMGIAVVVYALVWLWRTFVVKRLSKAYVFDPNYDISVIGALKVKKHISQVLYACDFLMKDWDTWFEGDQKNPLLVGKETFHQLYVLPCHDSLITSISYYLQNHYKEILNWNSRDISYIKIASSAINRVSSDLLTKTDDLSTTYTDYLLAMHKLSSSESALFYE